MPRKKVIYYRDWNELPAVLEPYHLALLFNKTERTIVNWAKAGKLEATKLPDNSLRFNKTYIKEMFEKNTA